jgi:hypothetical protein
MARGWGVKTCQWSVWGVRVSVFELCSVGCASAEKSVHLQNNSMLKAWLSEILNSDLADSIMQIAAAVTIQSHARRRLAMIEAQTRRDSGDYAFHEVMDGLDVLCWMTHSVYIKHIRQDFANVPTCYHRYRSGTSALVTPCDNAIGASPSSYSAFAPVQHEIKPRHLRPTLLVRMHTM